MLVRSPSTPQEIFSERPGKTTWVAHPAHGIDVVDAISQAQSTLSDTLLAIGPEGGFSDAEIELAVAHSCQIVSLGPRNSQD